MNNHNSLEELLKKHAEDFHEVVPFKKDQHVIGVLDLSRNNPAFTEATYETTESLSAFINNTMKTANASYLIGGYRELREMYRRSMLFDKNLENAAVATEEPRSLHLGIDIWADAGTPIFAPLDGKIHSLADNNNFGDYGATIILEHELENVVFYTLYGHLSVSDLANRQEADIIKKGEEFAHFGLPEENGHWPPHLHFQIIADMKDFKGDYPGVVKPSESGFYCSNCPDPDLILQMRG